MLKKEYKEKLNRAVAFAGEARTLVEEVHDAVQEAFDSKSETYQESVNGEADSAIISTLEECINSLEGIEGELGDAVK